MSIEIDLGPQKVKPSALPYVLLAWSMGRAIVWVSGSPLMKVDIALTVKSVNEVFSHGSMKKT